MRDGFYHPQQRASFVVRDTDKVQFIGSVGNFDIFHMTNPTPITYVRGINGGQWNYIWRAGEWQRDWHPTVRRNLPKPPPTTTEEQQTILNMVRCFAVALPEEYRAVPT